MAKSGAFISYARKDGEAFANALRERLQSEAPDLRVWQDRPEIEGGAGWWRQIEEALENVEFLIIVMTDAVLASEITRKEWCYARQQGVCVYPVKGPGFDFADPRLTSWMRKGHVYDLSVQWHTFVAHLRRGCKAVRVPFMAPDRPLGFVPRSREFGKLRSLLLDSAKRDPVSIVTALTGTGGFGKTTLAGALCHDDDVILAFDDGILWVTLGEQPNVADALAKLYAGLTGERPQFKDAEDVAATLAQKLEHKNCLIVIDDVWDVTHLRYFLRGGQQCGRLITTQQVEVAIEAGAKRVSVGKMTSDEAVAMLAARLKYPPDDVVQLCGLARRLGEWPLLLRLTASAIAHRVDRGDSVENALGYLSRLFEQGGVTVLDRKSADDRHAGVAATLAASMKPLDEGEQQRYRELAVFPENESVPLCVLSELWRLDGLATEHLVEKFANASLIDFDLRKGVVTIHDVLRTYLTTALGPDGLTQAHLRLVERWSDLRALPHEYAWRWLGYHLANAGHSEDLGTLLLDLDWLRAKLEATDIEALVREFDHAAQTAGLRLMQDALRLSAHALARNKAELAGQLLGRIPASEIALRESILERALAHPKPWLRPLHPALTNAGGPLLRKLAGHTQWVGAIALTPDGNWAVSGSYDGTLKAWDLETGRELRTLEGHTVWVRAVALTPDGKRAVSTSWDGALKAWDLETGRELLTLHQHAAGPAIALTTDGKRAVSGFDDTALRVWDVETGRGLHTLAGHTQWVGAIALTPDGMCAVSGSRDGTLKVWELETGRELRTLEGHTGGINAIALTPDGRRAVSGSEDGTLKTWDLEAGRELQTLEIHTHGVHAVALTSDGKRAVSSSYDGTLKVWDLATARELLTLETVSYNQGLTAIALTLDGKRAVSGSFDGSIRVWSLETRDELCTLEGNMEWVGAVALTSDGKRAVLGSDDGTLKIRHLETGRQLRTLSRHATEVLAIALTPDGKCAVSGSRDGSLKVWELESGLELRTLEGHTDGILAVVLTSDGKRAVSSSYDGILKVWDLVSGCALSTLEEHARRVGAMVATPDGKRAVLGFYEQPLKGRLGDKHALSGPTNGTLAVWDLEAGCQLRTLEGQTGVVNAIALTPDDKHVVSGSSNGTLTVWDLESGCQLRTLEGQAGRVRAIALTPDGNHVVSGSSEGALIVWDLATGEPVACHTADTGVLACVILIDAKLLVACDDWGTVHLLRLENFA